MNTKKLALLAAIMVACLLFAGCDDDNGDGVTPVRHSANSVLLRPTSLPTLLGGLVYEVWLAEIDRDSNWVEAQSLGKFFWDEYNFWFLTADGNFTRRDSVFAVNGNVYDYNFVAITLEAYPVDASPDPSPTVVAQSSVIPEVTTRMRFPTAFGAGTTGKFVIGTFSDGHWRKMGEPNRDKERHGLWFVELKIVANDDTLETYLQGLTLPVLPDTGYLYEGWVALTSGDTLSTGKFYFPDYQDYSAIHSKLRATPNFPGEDFLENRPARIPESRWPPDIASGGQVFVTVEPNPDDDPLRPSNFIVLRGNLPVRAAGNNTGIRETTFPMGNEAALTFPNIEAVFFNRSR